MDKLPAELLLCIFEQVQSLRDLVALRGVSRCFRDVADRSCAHISYQLGRTEFHAFDDAILAIRLALIPYASCCFYDKRRNAYSFVPSTEFLYAVMEGKPVPPGYPAIPRAPWVQECAAVMDLYLVALAWQSTAPDNLNDKAYKFPYGTEMASLGPRFLEAYLRSFYRVNIFESLFGPRVSAEPVLDAVAAFGMTKLEDDYTYQDYKEVLEDIRRVPFWWGPTAAQPVFDGFFEWLYSQTQPTNTVFQSQKKKRLCSETERMQLALLQFWKTAYHMEGRHHGETPSREHHVRTRLMNYSNLLPTIVYRPRLRVSPWSEPQAIIDHWTSPVVYSLVLERLHLKSASSAVFFASRGHDTFECHLRRELKTRFGMRYDASEWHWSGFKDDYGLLDPYSELHHV